MYSKNLVCNEATICEDRGTCGHSVIHWTHSGHCVNPCTNNSCKCIHLPDYWLYVCEHYITCDREPCAGKDPGDAKSFRNVSKIRCQVRNLLVDFIPIEKESFDDFIDGVFDEVMEEI